MKVVSRCGHGKHKEHEVHDTKGDEYQLKGAKEKNKTKDRNDEPAKKHLFSEATFVCLVQRLDDCMQTMSVICHFNIYLKFLQHYIYYLFVQDVMASIIKECHSQNAVLWALYCGSSRNLK